MYFLRSILEQLYCTLLNYNKYGIYYKGMNLSIRAFELDLVGSYNMICKRRKLKMRALIIKLDYQYGLKFKHKF